MADASATLQPDTKEGLGVIQDYFTIDREDADLVSMITRKLTSASKEHEKFKKEGKTNEDYWARDHFKTISLRWHNSRIIQNVIYIGVETMIPIITSRPAEPIITIADDEEDDEASKSFTDKLEKMLLAKYYDQDYPQQELMEMLARHLLLYKVGIPKILWDESIDDFIVEYLHPHKAILSPDGHYNQDVWMAQYLEKTLKEIVDEFPEKEDDILANVFPNVKVDMSQMGGTPIGFWEYQSEDGSYVVWKMNEVILQKKLNPYLIWKDKKFDPKANHFNYPHKPVMFLNSQNLGRHIWDDTTPVTQALPIQDGINLMQRIITDSARDQGILVGAQEFIDRDELYKYTGAPSDKLTVKGGDASRALYRVPPKQLADFVQRNLEHLLSMADNVLGTHATTRGERSGNQTLGQDQLAKESDYGRIDAIVRGIERLATEIYNWELQMMIVKYKPEHYARVLGAKKGQELYDEIQQYNKKGIKIMVKAGSTLPTDKISQRAEALDLAKLNRISNLDLFKRMDFPNPMEMAKNIWLEANAPEQLYKDLAPTMQQKASDQQAQVAAQQQVAPQVPPQLPQGVLPDAQTGMMPPPAPPVAEQQIPQGAPAMPVQPQLGDTSGQLPPQDQAQQLPDATEHTAALLQGIDVPPFEGIDPANYQDHANREFQFLATDGFVQQPNEIQALYAKHALAERDALQGNLDNAA